VRSLSFVAALVLALMPLGACACPPVVERYDGPEATLATWQSQLCHDDVAGEYRCLSTDLKRRLGNFSAYWTARDLMLDDQPLLRSALRAIDLVDHIEQRRQDDVSGYAELTLDVYGETTLIGFRRETLLLVELERGPPLVARSDESLAGLYQAVGGRRWIELSGTRLELTPEQLAGARSILLEHRWTIDAIEGLTGATP